MGLVQALTPTSAGAAQVFDVSGIAQARKQKQALKDKKLQDLMGEYDAKGTWKRDDAEIQRTISAVQNFAMENAEALHNPSKNIETWRKFQELQSDAKNTITYSIAAKKQFDAGMKTYMNGAEGRYLNDENKEALYNYSETPTADQYADKTAWDDPSKGFLRNVKLNPTKYTDVLEKTLQEQPPELGDELTPGKVITKKGKKLDREASEAALRPFWETPGLESGDLHQVHGQGEEGFQDFVDTYEAKVNVSPEYGVTTVATEEERKTDLDKAAAAGAFMKIRSGSGASLTESEYRFRGGETTGKGTKKDPYVKTGRGKASDGQFYTREALQEENKRRAAAAKQADLPTPEPLTFDIEEITGADAAMQTYGPATVGENTVSVIPTAIKKPMGEATNLTSGGFATEGELRFKEGQVVREVGVYKKARHAMSIRVKSKGKSTRIKIEAGQTLPNYTKMLEDGIIDKFTHSKLVANSKEFEGAVVMSIPETMNFFQMTSADMRNEGIQNIINSGKESYIVPLEDVQVELDQYGEGKYKTDYVSVADKMAELRGMSTTEQRRASNMPE